MKTLVVEDSRLAREGLVHMLERFANLEIVGTAGDVDAARALIGTYRPALLFLDIHMPGESGFELLESLDYEPAIIFTTAYSEYAIKSFDYQTVDYLLKPVSEERLAAAVKKLTRGPGTIVPDEPILALSSRIFVKDGDNCHLIEVAAINYVESCKNYVRLFFNDGKAFVKKSLNQVEHRLPQHAFFRASRQFIINLRSVDSIAEAVHGGYEVTMMDGRRIGISRRNAGHLKERLIL